VKLSDEIISGLYIQGDILFNNTNSAELLGKSCLFDYKSDEKFLFSNHLTRIKTKKTLDPRFFLFWINILWQNRYFQENCDRWVNQAAIRVEYSLFPREIPLPPTINDQILIADSLGRKLAENNKLQRMVNRQLEAIEALPGAYLREVFEFADS
jgi:type I restriction enzyme S subunit